MTDVVAIAGVRRQVRELVDGTLEVRIHVEPRHKTDFHRLFPEIDLPVAIAPLALNQSSTARGAEGVGANTSQAACSDDVAAGNAETQPRTPGQLPREKSLAERMHLNGYFFNRRLWAAMGAAEIYTQDDHKAWIAQQACVGPGPHQGEVCAHHTPSAALPAAGRCSDNPRKPPHWYTVPLCHSCHRDWAHGSGPRGATREDKQALVALAIQLTAEQVRFRVKHHLKLDSLRDLTQESLDGFEKEIGLQ